MSNILDSIATKFYDPLYEVVVFSSSEKASEERGFYYQGAPDDLPVTPQQFLSIVDSYEFNRLNFLRQAGLAWLVFPSATHTRFSHSLGCWLLSEWACDNIFVHQGLDVPSQEASSKRELLRLGPRLKESRWIEEFQLALLLHDIGHFPLSHIIENNDTLARRYSSQDRTTGIKLNHEQVGCRLIDGSGELFSLFKEYVGKQLGTDLDEGRFLSNILRGFAGTVDVRKITHLIDLDGDAANLFQNNRDRRFIGGVRELVSGVIDLDRIDHYHRDSHFMSIKAGEFNVHGLMNNMVLMDLDDCSRTLVQLISDGVGHAFQMLYAKRRLSDTVFHNPANLAYEVMMNLAINMHWDVADEDFKLYIPFLDDMQLVQTLLLSDDLKVRKIVNCIKLRQPINCVGKFVVSEEAHGGLGVSTAERRAAFVDRFGAQMRTLVLEDNECFLRLDQGFGKPDDDTEWMDLRQILGDNGCPLSEMEDHANFIEFIRRSDQLRARSFWVFVADRADVDRGRIAAEGVGGKRQ